MTASQPEGVAAEIQQQAKQIDTELQLYPND